MKTFLLCIFLLSIHSGLAQQFNWVATPPFTASTNISGLGYSVTKDPSGNVIVAGFKEQQFNYTDVFGTVAMTKYDGNGLELWSKIIGGHSIIYALETDSEGNILVAAGYVTSLIIGDFGLVTINQGIQFVALKFDSLGNLLWHQSIDDNPFMNGFRCITTDSANNIYIGYDDYGDSWIRKLSPDGVTLMTITQTNLPMLTSMSLDNNGNIYVAGSCANLNSMFAGTPAPTSLSYSAYVVKYSPNGVYQWHHYIQDITCEQPQVMAHSSEEIYFSGQLFGAYTFGSLTASGPQSSGYADFYIGKLNGSGIFEWVKEVPGLTGGVHTGHRNFIDSDAAGNIYFAGSYRGTINWSENISTSSINFQDDGLLLIYNNEGEIINALGFGGNQQDRSDGLIVDVSGIYISGITYGTATFGELSSNGGSQYYPFLTKLSALPLSVPESETKAIKLYPNPSTQNLYLSMADQITARIYNMQGQLIKQVLMGGNTSAYIGDLQSGVYIVDIGTQKFRFIRSE